MSKHNYYKTVKKTKNIRKTVLIVAAALLVCALIIFLIIRGLNNPSDDGDTTPLTIEEKYEKYVGPAECDERGEWVNINDYYGLFKNDHKETNLVSVLFANGELKGRFPQGVRLTPVMISYDDFEPCEGPMDKDFLSAYATNGESFELQLGVKKDAVSYKGAYDLSKNGKRYTGELALDLAKLSYYLLDCFDVEEDKEEPAQPSGLYGYIEPCLKFEFSGSAKACRYDADGKLSGTITSSLAGSLDNGVWGWTADIAGQQNSLFKNGCVYLRCKLPCTETITAEGRTETKNGIVNVYFRVDEVRIGTWQDCAPKSWSE